MSELFGEEHEQQYREECWQRDELWEELRRAAARVRCSECGGTGEGISVPAVTVGEPQPEEYPPCGRCKGRGWVVVDTETESEEESCQS